MTETGALPHDPYIAAVETALARHHARPATCWTDTDDNSQLIAVFYDWPDLLVDADTWPHDVYLAWDQSQGWQLVETGRGAHRLDPAGVDGRFAAPRQVACSAANALRGQLVTGPIAGDGPSWDSGPLERAVAAWEAAGE